jgi:hypothetical protein
VVPCLLQQALPGGGLKRQPQHHSCGSDNAAAHTTPKDKSQADHSDTAPEGLPSVLQHRASVSSMLFCNNEQQCIQGPFQLTGVIIAQVGLCCVQRLSDMSLSHFLEPQRWSSDCHDKGDHWLKASGRRPLSCQMSLDFRHGTAKIQVSPVMACSVLLTQHGGTAVDRLRGRAIKHLAAAAAAALVVTT